MRFVYGKQDMRTLTRSQEVGYMLTNGLGGNIYGHNAVINMYDGIITGNTNNNRRLDTLAVREKDSRINLGRNARNISDSS